MEKNKILVLYSHNPSRLEHLRKLRKLREKYNITLVLDENVDTSFQKDYVDNILKVPMKNVYEDIDNIVRQIKETIGIPDGIINISEMCVPLHSLLCKEFNIIGPSEEVVRIGRNKFEMRAFCKQLEIPVPKFELLNDNIDQICNNLTFPVVVKPTIGGGSTLVRRFDNKEELIKNIHSLIQIANEKYKNDALFAKYKDRNGNVPFVVEEIIGGDVLFPTNFPFKVGEISVESIYYNDEVTVLAIHDKPIPSNGPYFEEYIWSTPTRIPIELQEKAKEYVARIHKKLGKGCYVLHTEFRTFKDDLVLLEFGARLGGGPIYKSLVHSTKNDYLEILINLSMGLQPELSKDEPINTITHCLWAEKEGKVKQIIGEPKAIWDAYYCEHQIYDDIGEIAVRAPKSCRSNGHIVYKGNDISFDELEKRVIKGLNKFKFITEDE